MAAVEHAQLGVFVDMHLVGDLHPGALKYGRIAGIGKAVFDHPFPESLGAQGRLVAHPQSLLGLLADGRAHGWHDSVDHAARKGAVLADPVAQPLIWAGVQHQGLQHLAIATQVVAGGQRQAGCAARVAQPKTFGQQLPELGPIAFFGDSQGDPTQRRLGHGLHHLLPLAGRHA
jgi:hypothetical protein